MEEEDLNLVLIDKVLRGSDSLSDLLGSGSLNYSADTFFIAGQEAHKEDDLSRAFVHYREALELDPYHINAWHKLCVILYKMDLFFLAAQEYRSLLKLKSNDPIICYDAAKAFSMIGDLDEALKLFAKATDLYAARGSNYMRHLYV